MRGVYTQEAFDEMLLRQSNLFICSLGRKEQHK